MEQKNTEEKNIYQFPMRYREKNGKREGVFFEFLLTQKDSIYYLTDQAKTYEMLDKTFELKEPDVIKNIVAAIKEFNIKKIGNEFLVELVEWDSTSDSEKSEVLREAKYRLFAFISFVNSMAIFYV